MQNVGARRMKFGVLRVERQCGVATLKRFAKPFRFLQRLSAVTVGLRIIPVDANCRVETPNRCLEPLARHHDAATIEVRLSNGRIEGQGLTKCRERLIKTLQSNQDVAVVELGASVAQTDSHCIAQRAFSFPIFAELPLKANMTSAKCWVNLERATIQAFGIGKFAD